MSKGHYRIQSVSEITGVPAATLRAWERRYGVPSPMRTASSYRLYSEHDVELITRLRDLCNNEGMAPAEAARLVKESGVVRPEIDAFDGDAWTLTRDRIVAATQRFDPDGVENEIRYALCLGSAVNVFERVLGPALRAIGERWHAGEVSVAQEHMASELLGSAIRDLLRLVQPADAERTALLACFADEEHALPLYGVAYRLAQWGFRAVLLGARTPPDAIRDAVRALSPDIVGLSVTVTPLPSRAKQLVPEYGRAASGVPWIVGGSGAEGIRAHIEASGGMVANEDPAQLQVRLERALAGARSISS